jgi:hypothetical protein
MPITTRTEMKTLLDISDATYDDLIDAYIPIVQLDILEYCGGDKFKDTNKQREDITIAFVEGGVAADTITDSDSEFVSGAEFEDDMDILIEGSLSNDGAYTIDTVAAGTLTLTTDDDLIDEDAGEEVTITRLKWPKGILKYVAQMIWHSCVNIKSSSVKSERIGDYSVTYNNALTSLGWPPEVTNGLNKWRVVRFV